MKKTTLYLPRDLAFRLREAAKRRNQSQAELIRQAASEFLDREQRPKISCIGIASNPDFHGRDSEEWLKREWPKHFEHELKGQRISQEDEGADAR